MKSDGLVRHALIAFAIAVVFYVTGFSWMQHRRTFKGPWLIQFSTDTGGHPAMLISQRTLNISQKLSFTNDTLARTNFSETRDFTEATTNLPFGEMLMQDPLYLPGTLAMRLFGHQVEILPRTLIIDNREIPWGSQAEIDLKAATNTPSPR